MGSRMASHTEALKPASLQLWAQGYRYSQRSRGISAWCPPHEPVGTTFPPESNHDAGGSETPVSVPGIAEYQIGKGLQECARYLIPVALEAYKQVSTLDRTTSPDASTTVMSQLVTRCADSATYSFSDYNYRVIAGAAVRTYGSVLTAIRGRGAAVTFVLPRRGLERVHK